MTDHEFMYFEKARWLVEHGYIYNPNLTVFDIAEQLRLADAFKFNENIA